MEKQLVTPFFFQEGHLKVREELARFLRAQLFLVGRVGHELVCRVFVGRAGRPPRLTTFHPVVIVN